MNIAVLEGYVCNPGDLSWDGFECYKKWFNIRNIHNCHIRNCFRKGSISF